MNVQIKQQNSIGYIVLSIELRKRKKIQKNGRQEPEVGVRKVWWQLTTNFSYLKTKNITKNFFNFP